MGLRGVEAEVDRILSVLRMDMVRLKYFFVPLMDGISKNLDRLRPYVGKLPGLGACLPRDAIDGFGEKVKPLPLYMRFLFLHVSNPGL